MKNLWIFLSCFAGSLAGYAQKIKPLQVGDKVPDIVFKKMLNYKTTTAKLSQFKGKIIILDLWATNCSSCIQAFPEMEAAQKELGSKVDILLVNPYMDKRNTEAKIKEVLTKQQARFGYYPSLPMPIYDTILTSYFPHQAVPHQVWIDSNRRVMAITGSTKNVAAKLKDYFAGKRIILPAKNDWSFDHTQPILTNDNGGSDTAFMFRALFTPFLDGLPPASGRRVNASGKLTGYYQLNTPLLYLVNIAWMDEVAGMSRNRYIIDVKDPAKFAWELNPELSYNYDLTVPPVDQKLFDEKPYLKEDLRRTFNIRFSKQVRRMKCLVFTASDILEQKKSVHSKSDMDLDSLAMKKFIHHQSTADIIKLLNYHSPVILINESPEQIIDIDFPDNFRMNNTEALVKFMQEYGFVIKEEEREIEMVIITDK